MTTAQLQALKTYIANDGTLSAIPNNTDGAFEIAALLNVPASPDYYVWRTVVPQSEIMLNGFDWVRVDNLSIGKARIWEWLFDNESTAINAAQANVRAGIIECWKGTQADLDVRLVVLQHCQRLASRVEKALATGSGTATTVNGTGPAVMGVEGPISYLDVHAARNLP